jgi:hypothetical protein
MRNTLSSNGSFMQYVVRLLAVAFACYLSSQRVHAIYILPPFLADGESSFALVRGEVIDCDDFEKVNPQRATIKIHKVYTGPKDLLNSKFTDMSSTYDRRAAHNFAWPSFSTKEKTGLWVLSKTKEGWEVSSRYRRVPDSHGPETECYPRLIEQAEILERMAKLSQESRYSLAKLLCEHQTSHVARFAVQYIFLRLDDKAKGADASKFLEKLANNPRVGLLALQEADELFLAREQGGKEGKWRTSDSREPFLERFKSPANAEECYSIVGHLNYMAPFEFERALELLGVIFDNPRITRSLRLDTLDNILECTAIKHQGGPMFTTLTRVLKRADEDPVIREAAATWLGKLGSMPYQPPVPPLPISAEQLELLRSLLKSETDPKVAEALKSTIDRFTAKKR